MTQECLVNGVNSSLEDSFECSGYLMEDIIEYCGGVDGEATTMRGWADDGEGWDFCVELEDALRNGSMIAVEYYGHELTAYQGAPAVLVQPGFPGGTWVKYLKKVQIGTDDVTAPIQIVGGDEFYANPEDPHLYTCNSAWFHPARDGQVFKVGEPIEMCIRDRQDGAAERVGECADGFEKILFGLIAATLEFNAIVLALFDDAQQLICVHGNHPFGIVPWRDFGAIGAILARLARLWRAFWNMLERMRPQLTYPRSKNGLLELMLTGIAYTCPTPSPSRPSC